MKRRNLALYVRPAALLVVIELASGDPARAAGINTDVALPVNQGSLVYRTQLRFLDAGDASAADRDVQAWVIPTVLVYGAAARTTLIGIVPYVFQSVELTRSGQRATERSEGVGDLTVLVRQTVYASDAVQRTSRLGLLVGTEIPSGSSSFSSHGVDFIVGGVYTLLSGRQEFDTDLTWKVNGEGRDVDEGEELRVNSAYQLRVFPWSWPEQGSPAQIFGVLEANFGLRERTVSGGQELDDSGGTLLFISPGLQLVTRRVIYEASLQIPVARDLNGVQTEPDVAAAVGVRVQF